MICDFQKGDIVQLKSGGPKMTVEAIKSAQISCVWFVGEVVFRNNFEPSILKKIHDEKDLPKMNEEFQRTEFYPTNNYFKHYKIGIYIKAAKSAGEANYRAEQIMNKILGISDDIQTYEAGKLQIKKSCDGPWNTVTMGQDNIEYYKVQ